MNKKRALLTLSLIVSLAGANILNVSAEQSDHETTENKVGFEAGDEGTTDPIMPEITDEEEAAEFDKKEKATKNEGLLRLDVVPVFDFGLHEITLGNKSYNAELPVYKFKQADDKVISFYQPYNVQVTDVRGTGDGWRLDAQLTKQFTNAAESGVPAGKELEGASIRFENLSGAAKPGATPADKLAQKPVLEYAEGKDSTVKLAEATEDNGMGVSVVRFGKVSETQEKFADYTPVLAGGDLSASNARESVTLDIPASTTVYAGTYYADILWTLSSGVDNL